MGVIGGTITRGLRAVAGSMLLLLVLEATRRSIGIPLIIVALTASFLRVVTVVDLGATLTIEPGTKFETLYRRGPYRVVGLDDALRAMA